MPNLPKRLLFGTAGVPDSSNGSSTVSGIERTAELGLGCMEIEFVRGVHMDSETALKVRRTAERLGIKLSAHAPYFINLNSEDPGKRIQSQERLLKSARRAAECGAGSVVFHAGYYGRSAPEEAYRTIKNELSVTLSIIRRERLPITLRIETMGKKSQFGSLDEVFSLCREIEGLEPCLDFSHLHARKGRENSFGEFERILAKTAKKLGPGALKKLHLHIAGIHFRESGEIKHLNLAEADFLYEEWLEALYSAGAAGLVICESPNLEIDALMLKNMYDGLQEKQNDFIARNSY